MSNHARKLDCNKRRGQKHRDSRRDKRKQTQAHSKQTPRGQRRALQFPTIWQMPVKAWTRSKAA